MGNCQHTLRENNNERNINLDYISDIDMDEVDNYETSVWLSKNEIHNLIRERKHTFTFLYEYKTYNRSGFTMKDTAIHDAVQLGDARALRAYLNDNKKYIDLNAGIHYQSPLLITAVDGLRKADYRCAQILLENGADVNTVDRDNCTLLHNIVDMKYCEYYRLTIKMMELLYEYNINPNIKNKDGETALDCINRSLNDEGVVEYNGLENLTRVRDSLLGYMTRYNSNN
jgi:hypothetical protein